MTMTMMTLMLSRRACSPFSPQYEKANGEVEKGFYVRLPPDGQPEVGTESKLRVMSAEQLEEMDLGAGSLKSISTPDEAPDAPPPPPPPPPTAPPPTPPVRSALPRQPVVTTPRARPPAATLTTSDAAAAAGLSWFVKTESFCKPFAEVKASLAAHKQWVAALRAAGEVPITSGYRVDANGRPGGGGLMVFAAADHAAAEALCQQDPLVANGCVDWEVNGWVAEVGDIALCDGGSWYDAREAGGS